MTWDKTEVDFGKVKPKMSYACTFAYFGDKAIAKVKASCGCTAARVKDHFVSVQYTAPQFPPHLRIAGTVELPVNKQITVHFNDNTKDTLTVKGMLCIS